MSATSLVQPSVSWVLGLSSAVCNTPLNHHSAWLQTASLNTYLRDGRKKISRQPESCEMDYIYIHLYTSVTSFLFFSGHWKRRTIGTHLCNIISPCRDAWLHRSEAKSQQHFNETLVKQRGVRSAPQNQYNYLISQRDCLWPISQHIVLHYVFVLQGQSNKWDYQKKPRMYPLPFLRKLGL